MSVFIKKVIKKIINKRYIFYIKLFESTFGYGHKRIKFLLIKNNSDKLVIVFSGFAAKKNAAVYNMVRTLNDVKINKLFILDDFGYEKKGSYYLGEDGDFFISNLVTELIDKVKADLNIRKIYSIGSSKGGSAAIYFGLKQKVDFIIAGAPQYLIGNYLSGNEALLKTLYSIVGKTNDKAITFLNGVIKNVIINYTGNHKPRILIHYSKNEYTYKEHIIFMLRDLKESGFNVEENIEDYYKHSDVALYFPNLCRNKLKELTDTKAIN